VTAALMQLLRAKASDPTARVLAGEFSFSWTYLNPHSYHVARLKPALYADVDYIAADGMLLAALMRLVGIRGSRRFAFDFTSLASLVFDKLNQQRASIALIGGTAEEAERARMCIEKMYPAIEVRMSTSGYMDTHSDFDRRAAELARLQPTAVIVGMGFPRQDAFVECLREHGYRGATFTCGAFIHQLARSGGRYYPRWINRLHLRAVYRVVKEPYVLKRLILQYPRGMALFLFDSVCAYLHDRGARASA
jgi:UDP-Gal:alpha-D-GlcNAc-diphosphoundecaprenol beta-1,4-galactosyltransferase